MRGVTTPQERPYDWYRGRDYAPRSTQDTVSIADIQIDNQFVYTPVGQMRRDQTRWTISDTRPRPPRVPSWAIACAILLFFCVGPFSLLFLLAKETYGETTTVRLSDGAIVYIAQIDTYDQSAYQYLLKIAEWSQRALPERRAIDS